MMKATKVRARKIEPDLTERQEMAAVVIGSMILTAWLAIAIGLPVMGLFALVKYVFGG